MFKRTIIVMSLLGLVCASSLMAQSAGRVFINPGVIDGEFLLHFGGGGDLFIAGPLGATADLGYLFDPDRSVAEWAYLRRD